MAQADLAAVCEISAATLSNIERRRLPLPSRLERPLAKALVSCFGALSVAVFTEMLVIAKRTGLDPAGLLEALPLLAPGMGTPPPALSAQIVTGQYQSELSAKRLHEDLARVLDAARAAASPAVFLPLLQAAALAAGHSPRATGDALDVARWISDNGGVAFGAKGVPPTT